MEYIYAALILHRLGKEVNEANIRKVIESAGGSPDDTKIKALVSALEGVNIEEAIKTAAPVAVAATPTAKKEEKKEERKTEEEASAGLSALFG